LNLQLEKRFHLFGYYWALRGGFDDLTGASNPVVVNADVTRTVSDVQRLQSPRLHVAHPLPWQKVATYTM